MNLWQKIKSFVKKIWRGGGGNSPSPSGSRTQTRPSGGSTTQRVSSGGQYSFNRRELLNSLRGEGKTESQKKTADSFKASSNTFKHIAKPESSPYKRMAESSDKTKEELRSKLKKLDTERKEFHRVTGNKYNTEVGTKEERARARQRIKSGDYQSDPEVAKHAVKYHPVAESVARGALSGVTFGASDLAAKKLTKGKAKEAEEYYQKNKNKTAETVGEIAGSLAAFGATAGATEKAGEALARKGASVARKVAPKAAEKVAVKAASATEKLAAKVGKEKAAQIIKAVGTDVVQNMSTGLLYDFNNASTEYKVGSDDWWKEMGKSAAFNAAITGGVAGASVIRGGRQLAKRTAEEAAERGVKEAAENLPTNYKVGLNRRRRADVVLPNARQSADEVAETLVREPAPTVEDTLINEPARTIEDTLVREPEAKRPATDADSYEQMTLEDLADTPEVAKKAPPKTKEQIKAEQAEDEKVFRNLDGLNKATREADSSMRAQTKGEYGVRQSERTAAEHAPIEEAKRIKKEVDDVSNALNDGSIKEMFVDENTPFSVFKTANKEERKKVAESATARVNESSKKVADRLYEKAERLKEDLLNNSALTSNEHVTLDDIADVIALRNRASSNGIKLPDKYEEAFSHIIEWQRTESAQMLKATDLFLKENDQNYRRMLLARDMDKYLRKVLNADDATIADIKRSLDANNGEGYFDNMIEELSKFSGDKNEAAFKKAYADFQAEVFMNTRPTVWDTVNLWRHTLMLSSPKTGANNVIGNVLQRTMYNISDALNMMGESLARGIDENAKRTTAILKSEDQRRLARMYTSGKRGEKNLKKAKYLSGFADQDFADTINMVADADVNDMMASSKYMGEVVKGLKYKPKTAGGKLKQSINNAGGAISTKYVSTMLNEPDSWFVERNYRSALLKYLEANGVNSAESLKGNEALLKEAREYAKDVALENTYKKANNVVSFLEGIRKKGHTKGSNLGYKTGAIMLDAELPYLKVPANLIVNNFKYSPMGVFNVAADAYKYVVNGDVNALNKATRDLSKSLTGTGMAALGYMMFCKDQTDDDSWGFIGDAKDELKEYGVRDNSFKIGDKNFSIANMGIGSVQFLMGAALAEDLAEQGKTPPHQVALDALGKTVDTVADMSLMENAVSLLDAFGNGGDYNATVSQRLGNAATEIAGDYAAQFIANPLRGVAKGLTDADLDTGVRKGDTSKVQRILERNRNNFVQGVPVLNERVLPHRVDTHGNLIGERDTAGDKAVAVANNLLNPLSPRTVNIPDADKEELKVTKDDGTAYKPKGFDSNREYKAKVGQGKGKVEIDLTGKEREQVARSAKYAGYDGAKNLVKKGMFGDRLGERAQEILNNIPDDEEKAREYIFSTPEWKNASNAQKEKWLNSWYGEGQGNTGKGVGRTQNAEAFINIAGNSEGDFRWQNDISSTNQKKYTQAGLADIGISKGAWVDILEACQDSNHKWNEETLKNQDIINSAKKTKLGILAVEGLTPEQRVAAYNVIRGKRTGFGWNDWDGVSGGYSGYRRRGYRRRGYRHYGGGSRKSSAPALKQSDYKASKATYKSLASSLKTNSTSSKPTTSRAKVEPPKVKFKKYEV